MKTDAGHALLCFFFRFEIELGAELVLDRKDKPLDRCDLSRALFSLDITVFEGALQKPPNNNSYCSVLQIVLVLLKSSAM